MNTSSQPPEEHVPLYRYPQRFLYVEVVLFSLVSTLMIFAFIPALISFFAYGSVISSAFRAMIFLNVTAVALLLLFFFIKGEVKNTVYYISGTYVCRRNSGGIIRAPLDGIRTVSLLKYPLGAGIVVLEGAGGTLSIPLIICNAGELLRRIEDALRGGASDTGDPQQWNSIHATAQKALLVDRRSQRFFGTLLGVCIFMLPLNIFTGAFYWDMAIVPLAVWTVSGPFFPLAGYAVADMIIRWRERSDTARGSGESAVLSLFTDTVLVRSALVIGCCYCVFAVFYRTLVV